MFPQRRPDVRPPPAAGSLLIRLQPRPDAGTGLHAERQGCGRASRARSGGDTLDTTHEVYRATGGELDGSPLDAERVTYSREASSGILVARDRDRHPRRPPPADETELAPLRGLVDGLREELQRERDEAAGDRQ